MRPVEGTILTVVRERPKRSRPTGRRRRSPSVLERAYDAACDAVEKTPQLLPVLRDAGVVDAGGKGFTLLLAALLEVVDGRADPRAGGRQHDPGRRHRAPRGRRRRRACATR